MEGTGIVPTFFCPTTFPRIALSVWVLPDTHFFFLTGSGVSGPTPWLFTLCDVPVQDALPNLPIACHFDYGKFLVLHYLVHF